MVKTKPGLKLRKIGSQYMIADACDGNVNMSSVYTLNQTAAQLWTQIEEGNSTPEGLADYLCEIYETNKDTALHDVERQLAEWKSYGLIC